MPDEDPGVIPEEVQRLLSEELERNLITGAEVQRAVPPLTYEDIVNFVRGIREEGEAPVRLGGQYMAYSPEGEEEFRSRCSVQWILEQEREVSGAGCERIIPGNLYTRSEDGSDWNLTGTVDTPMDFTIDRSGLSGWIGDAPVRFDDPDNDETVTICPSLDDMREDYEPPEYNDWPKGHLIDCWNCGEEIWTIYDHYTCPKCEVGYDAHFKPNPTASWTRHWWEYETHRTGMLYVYMDRYHVRPRDIIDHQTQHVPCPA